MADWGRCLSGACRRCHSAGIFRAGACGLLAALVHFVVVHYIMGVWFCVCASSLPCVFTFMSMAECSCLSMRLVPTSAPEYGKRQEAAKAKHVFCSAVH